MDNKDKVNLAAEYAIDMFNGNTLSIDKHNFNSVYIANVYARTCLNILKSHPITPDITALAARLYLMCKTNPVASVFVLDRNNRIKYIFDFAKNYRAELSEFVIEIHDICKIKKSKSCIVVYNYNSKKSFYNELYEIDKLYSGLEEIGITLKDAVKVVSGKSISIISPFKD